MVYGAYDCLLPDDEQLYVYTRTLGDETVLVVLNWSDEPATFDSSTVETTDAEVLSSNYTNSTDDPSTESLKPFEATVYRIGSR